MRRLPNPVEFSRMSDAELVALVGNISEAKALQLLWNIGGFRGLIRAGGGELAVTVGPAAAARIMAARELGHRVLEEAAKEAPVKLPNDVAVYQWSRARLALLDHEELWILPLDGAHGLIGARMVAAGGLHGLHVGPRDPVRIALREGASAFVLVHNHPGGNTMPSDEDVALTKAVYEAAKVVGVPLLDHVIVARTGYKSMLDLGLLS